MISQQTAQSLGIHKSKIFTNDFVQGITIVTSVVVGIATLWYFYHEVRTNKKIIEKNNIEIEKLQKEIKEIERKEQMRRVA